MADRSTLDGLLGDYSQSPFGHYRFFNRAPYYKERTLYSSATPLHPAKCFYVLQIPDRYKLEAFFNDPLVGELEELEINIRSDASASMLARTLDTLYRNAHKLNKLRLLNIDTRAALTLDIGMLADLSDKLEALKIHAPRIRSDIYRFHHLSFLEVDATEGIEQLNYCSLPTLKYLSLPSSRPEFVTEFISNQSARLQHLGLTRTHYQDLWTLDLSFPQSVTGLTLNALPHLLPQHPQLEQIQALYLETSHDLETRLLETANLPMLSTLTINDFNQADINMLRVYPNPDTLKRLTVRGWTISAPELAPLADIHWLRNIDALDVSHFYFHDNQSTLTLLENSFPNLIA